MALSLAAAALGSAAIGAASSAYGSSQSKKAAKKTLAAQNAATDKQLAAQQAALYRITGLNQPFIDGGQQSYAALLSQFGITPSAAPQTPAAPRPALSYGPGGNMVSTPQAAPAALARPSSVNGDGGYSAKINGGPAGTSPLEAQTTTAPAGGPDYSAYYQQYPDLQAEYARLEADPNSAAMFNSPEEYAQYHAQTFHDRPVPNAAPPQAQEPQAPAPADPNAAPDYMNAARPDAQAPPTSFGEAPDLNSFFSKFEEDPGAAYRRTQALDAVNAKSAARGKLRSGDTMSALATRASDLASQEYNNWFSRQNTLYNNANSQYNNQRAYDTSLWQYGTDRGDRNFNTDRSYQTGREDTRIGNLFDLTRIGTGAAANVSGAVTNNANNQTGIYGSQANNQADAAYARANANAGLAGSLAGTASNLFANWGGGSGGFGAQPTVPPGGTPFNPAAGGNWARGTW